MALDPMLLSANLFEAFSKNTELTKEAQEELQKKCDDISFAILDFVLSIDITAITTFAPGQINVAGTPAAQSNPVPIVGKADVTVV